MLWNFLCAHYNTGEECPDGAEGQPGGGLPRLHTTRYAAPHGMLHHTAKETAPLVTTKTALPIPLCLGRRQRRAHRMETEVYREEHRAHL